MIIVIPERQEEGITFHYDGVEAFIPKNSYEWVDIKLKNEEVIRISGNVGLPTSLDCRTS